jgi:hypothetical protein
VESGRGWEVRKQTDVPLQYLARDKVAREAAAEEEHWQSLAMGLSGLTLTILAPASITRTASGSSTQSKGKRKATEEDPSASQYFLFLYSFFIHH